MIGKIMEELKVASIDEIKNEGFDVFLTLKEIKDLFERIGYEIDNTGIILDKNTRKPVEGIDTEEINIKRKSDDIALISGSHSFAKNIAELSQILVKRGIIKFQKV